MPSVVAQLTSRNTYKDDSRSLTFNMHHIFNFLIDHIFPAANFTSQGQQMASRWPPVLEFLLVFSILLHQDLVEYIHVKDSAAALVFLAMLDLRSYLLAT